jgi:hypothetical protein
MSERGEYASIPKVLLDGPDFQRLPPNARFAFLAMCLTFNGLGIEVRYPEALVADLVAQTGLTADEVRKTLDVLEHQQWIRREANIVWLKGRLDHSGLTLSNPKKHVPHVRKVVAGLPRLDIVREFVLHYSAWFEDEAGKRIDSLSWVGASLSKRYRKPTDRLSKGIDTLSIADRLPTDSQELPKNFPNQDVITAADASVAKNWVADFTQLWRDKVGHITEGHLGKATTATVEKHGIPTVREALAEYAEHPPNGRAKKIEWFNADIVRWIAEAKEPLEQDGVLTAKGRRFMGVAS